MRQLNVEGYCAMDTDERMAFLQGGPFPQKVVAIHVDDGWKSSHHAVPALERYGLRAAFWTIAGSRIGGPAHGLGGNRGTRSSSLHGGVLPQHEPSLERW